MSTSTPYILLVAVRSITSVAQVLDLSETQQTSVETERQGSEHPGLHDEEGLWAPGPGTALQNRSSNTTAVVVDSRTSEQRIVPPKRAVREKNMIRGGVEVKTIFLFSGGSLPRKKLWYLFDERSFKATVSCKVASLGASRR